MSRHRLGQDSATPPSQEAFTAWLVTAWTARSNIIRRLLVRGEFACLLPPPRTALRLALTTLNVADDFQPVEMPPPYAVERPVEMQACVQKPGCYTAQI
ncbi:MAG: hypothetical protein HN849_01440 [Victivallales bacterium]|nr:hypothetical protein [Victivallales bacterium]